MKKHSFWKKIGLFIASIGPGIFLIGYNIGTGSVTTAASIGAKYGMTLVWPLLLSCIFTYVLIIAFGRYTVVTGQTSLSAFREHFNKGLSLFVLISIVASEWVAFAGVMGVVTEVVKEWSRPLTATGEGFSMLWISIFFAALLYYLFWNGKYRFFEKILTIFVGIMGLSFVLTMFMVITDPAEVIRGLLPKIPQETHASLLIAGMVGTTMGGVLFVVRSILVKQKGWTIQDLATEKRDAIVSASIMFLLSVAVMASAAGTLYLQGRAVDNAIAMVKLLEPLAGRFAISIFVAGIVAAGLSSMLPHLLLAPWLYADYAGKPMDMKLKYNRAIALFTASLGLTVPIFGGRPVFVMIISQALITIATPLIVLLMIILLNKKELMGEQKVNSAFNRILWIIFLFTVYMAITGILGIIGTW
ncbi:MAG TPA: hypothetical protein EYP36_08450 [Calditrichaeota bacterium]|nr:hypothetical protein [Calditrichota bacterium]